MRVRIITQESPRNECKSPYGGDIRSKNKSHNLVPKRKPLSRRMTVMPQQTNSKQKKLKQLRSTMLDLLKQNSSHENDDSLSETSKSDSDLADSVYESASISKLSATGTFRQPRHKQHQQQLILLNALPEENSSDCSPNMRKSPCIIPQDFHISSKPTEGLQDLKPESEDQHCGFSQHSRFYKPTKK